MLALDRITDSHRLTVVRWLHIIVYLVMVTATFALLYSGVTGARGAWVWVSMALLAMEGMALLLGRMRCPLTVLAVRYGAEKGWAFDTFLPERLTHYTGRFFGTLAFVGFVLAVLRLIGIVE